MYDKPFRTLVNLWATREQTLHEWQRFNDLYDLPREYERQYKPSRIKWGHPGKGRRRKARIAARNRQREIAQLLAKVRSLADVAVVPPHQIVKPRDVVADYLATRGSGKDIWDTREAQEYITSLRRGDDE